jgi:prevent-host-death family protein
MCLLFQDGSTQYARATPRLNTESGSSGDRQRWFVCDAVDKATFMTYYMVKLLARKGDMMKRANVAEFKNQLSHFLALVEQGEEVEVCKRNVPFARVSPLPQFRKNQTKLGCDLNSVIIKADLTEPAIPEGDWEMLKAGK